MDIEERCHKAWLEWQNENLPPEYHYDSYGQDFRDAFKDGYMAGVAQTQKDYVAYYGGKRE